MGISRDLTLAADQPRSGQIIVLERDGIRESIRSYVGVPALCEEGGRHSDQAITREEGIFFLSFTLHVERSFGICLFFRHQAMPGLWGELIPKLVLEPRSCRGEYSGQISGECSSCSGRIVCALTRIRNCANFDQTIGRLLAAWGRKPNKAV